MITVLFDISGALEMTIVEPSRATPTRGPKSSSQIVISGRPLNLGGLNLASTPATLLLSTPKQAGSTCQPPALFLSNRHKRHHGLIYRRKPNKPVGPVSSDEVFAYFNFEIFLKIDTKTIKKLDVK